MATILHIYPSHYTAKGAFDSSMIPGKRMWMHKTIQRNDGVMVRFVVLATIRDAEFLRGLNIQEVFWHYQPTEKLETFVKSLQR